MTYTCRTCKDVYTGRTCLRCKRNRAAVAKGLTITECIECHKPAACTNNGACRPCMRAMGLKECADCHNIECDLLYFNRHQSRCKACEFRHRRKLEKVKSRQADIEALTEGKSPTDLRRENSHFAQLNVRWCGGKII